MCCTFTIQEGYTKIEEVVLVSFRAWQTVASYQGNLESIIKEVYGSNNVHTIEEEEEAV